MAQTAAPAIPFPVASQYSTRPSFDLTTQTLSASAPTQVSPVQIPAVGYLQGLLLEVTIDGTGGTAPAFTADGPFNVIQSINFRNASGVNLIAPVTGYDLYLMNKYGGQVAPGFGPYANPKFGFGYADTAPDAHFFLWLPLGFDISDAYGVIPALASNANYQMELSLAAIPTVMSGAPTSVTVSISATAHYFDLPAAANQAGVAQATSPGSQATSVWQKETPTVTAGYKLQQLFNVGNVIRNHILVLRDEAGARLEAAWPDLTELYLDNQPRFSFSEAEWEFLMSRWYGLADVTKDSDNGLDNGVFVLPFHTLLGSAAGDPSNTRAQLLPTLNATLLQYRFQDFGANAARLEVLTESITTTDAATLYSK